MILVNRQISKAGIYQGISLLWSLGRCLHFFGLMDYYSQPCKFFYLLFLSFILLFWKYNNLNLCQCTMHIKYPFNWLGHHKYSINIETLPHNLVVFSILKSFSEEIIDKGNSYQKKHSSCILSYSFRGLIILSSWWGAWWHTDTQWCCSSSWELTSLSKGSRQRARHTLRLVKTSETSKEPIPNNIPPPTKTHLNPSKYFNGRICMQVCRPMRSRLIQATTAGYHYSSVSVFHVFILSSSHSPGSPSSILHAIHTLSIFIGPHNFH